MSSSMEIPTHFKMKGMLVNYLSAVKKRFWSHLGCSASNGVQQELLR